MSGWADAAGATAAGGVAAAAPRAEFAELARAKVNLSLSILGRRPDGYHALESLVVFADVGDIVTLKRGVRPALEVSGPFAGSIEGVNILQRAITRVSHAAPGLRLGAIALEKRLPAAAGLGGGSADAGALLRAIARANPSASGIDWAGLAAALGADVPVCLAAAASLMWGIGERIVPVQNLPCLAAVIADPGLPPLSDKTRRVFSRLAAQPVTLPLSEPRPPPRFSHLHDLVAYLGNRCNDLAGPARELMPASLEVERALAASRGCVLARMSGAGPSCFGLYETAHAAEAAARELSRSRPGWWVRPVALS